MSRNRRRAVATAIAGVIAVAPMVSGCGAGLQPQVVLPTQLAEGINATVHQIAIRNAFLLGPVPGQQLAAGSSVPLYAWFVNTGTAADRLVSIDAPGVAQSVQAPSGGIALPPSEMMSTVQGAAPKPVGPGTGPSSGVPVAPGSSGPATTPGATGPKKSPAAGRSATPGAPASSATPGGATTPGTPATGSPTPGAPAQGSPSPGVPGTLTPSPTVPGAPPGAPTGQVGSSVILQGLAKPVNGLQQFRLTLHFQRAGAVTLEVPVVARQGDYATYAPAPSAPTTGPVGQAPGATPAQGAANGKPAKAKAKAKHNKKAKKATPTPSA